MDSVTHTSGWFSKVRAAAPSVLCAVLALAVLHYRYKAATLQGHLRAQVARQVPLDTVAAYFPSAASVDYCGDPSSACVVRDSSGQTIGRLLCSSPYCDDIKGYAGSVPLLIALDTASQVKRIIVLPNSETGSFLARLRREGFFENWNGAHVETLAEKGVDALSGATMTSAAVIASVRRRAGLYVGLDGSATSRSRGGVRQILAVLFMLPGIAAMAWPKFGRRLRLAVLFSNVVVLGFGTGTLLSLAFAWGSVVSGVNWAHQWHLVLIAAVTIGVALLTGKNVYCGHLCPFGSAQELMGRIRPAWHVRLPHWSHLLLQRSRSVILGAVFIVALAWPGMDLGALEPFASFLVTSAPVSAIVIAVIFLGLSLIRPRLWCGAFCPTGRLLDLFRVHH